jgi:hypothetical protein
VTECFVLNGMFPFHLAEFSDKKKQWKVHVAALVSV